MKLYHRTSFWGKDLHGYKARGHKLPIIQVQAIISDEGDDSKYGCCRHHGRRVVMIDESHFIANERDSDWNLYHVKTVLGEETPGGDFFHDFALIPMTRCNKKNIGQGWTLLGSVRPCAARMDLAPLLRPFLVKNNNTKYVYAKHHAHVALAMNKVTIQEPRPRTKQQEDQQKERKQQQEVKNGEEQTDNDARWQQPRPGMPFYSRNNTLQDNATTAIDSKSKQQSVQQQQQQYQENDTPNAIA